MPQLEMVAEGVIYRNPNPGYQSIMAANSSLVQISESELLCLYNRGQAYYAPDMECYLARSIDGGTTWFEESLVYNGANDKLPQTYNGPMTTRLRDGSLAVFTFRRERHGIDYPLFNEATGGLREVDNVLFHSADKGVSWDGPHPVAMPDGFVITPSSPLVELENGNWLLHFDQWHGFNEPGPYQPRSVIMISADRGRTWSTPLTFADGKAEGKGFWHGRIIKLATGKLFTLFWSAEMPEVKNITLHRCFGSPDGRTWSTPEATNISGQTNWPVDLGDGQMAAIYTQRESERPGFFVTLSTDEGKNWDLDNQICVWDATCRDKLGVNAPDSYPRSHDTIAFGAPTAIRLLNGDIYVSFWCTEMSVTHVRYGRLKVI